MKTMILSLVLFLSTSTLAASPEVFQAVLKQEQIAGMVSIDSMKVTKVLRCPGCYEILVVGEAVGFVDGTSREYQATVRTHLDLTSDQYSAEIVSQTK